MSSVTRVNPRVAALNIHFVYLCQEGSREQVILDVRVTRLSRVAQPKSANWGHTYDD